MGIRERVLKSETKRLASRFVSDENAEKVANHIFDDSEEENNKENIPVNGKEPSEDSSTNGILDKIDSWLAEYEEEAEQKMDETPDPVTDLDSMEDRLDELENDNK
jgi:hypothetical protein